MMFAWVRDRGPFILIGFGAALIAVAIGILLSHNLGRKSQRIAIPPSIAGLDHEKSVYGMEAIDGINRLHGLAFPLTSGVIGEYGDRGQITLWVSATSSKGEASDLERRMEEKISQSEGPFQELSSEVKNGVQIHVLEGLGQRHYYFQAGNLLIWLASDHSLAHQALSDTLLFYLDQ